jgi:hypothetical protein
MDRPVRPVALVILTACMIYPGATMLWQGLYPFVANEWFNLVGDPGPWMTFFQNRLGMDGRTAALVTSAAKTAIGGMWVAGVLGIWAGDWRAYPLALGAAALSLLHPGGSMVMAVIALICLIFFREKPEEVPA